MEHGVTYKISSMKDGMVLDVADWKFSSGNPVLTYPWYNQANQKWTVRQEGVGYQLRTAGSVRNFVLDEDVTNSCLSIYTFHGGENQQWVTTPVPNLVNAYFIKNIGTDKVLTHPGGAAQVTTSIMSGCACSCNSSQWWTFTKVSV